MAAALLGVAAGWAAAAPPASEAVKLEKRQAAESRKAKELAARAASAAKKVSTLSENLAGIGGAKAATDAARAEAAARQEAVKQQAEADASDLADARDRLESTVIRFLQDEPAAKAGLIDRPGPGATVASFFTMALSSQVNEKQNRIAEAEASLVEIGLRRQALDGQAEALAAASARTAAEMAAAAKERDRLNADSEAAAARAMALARQARDLRDLAARAAAARKTAQQPKILAVAPGGKRMAPSQGVILVRYNGQTRSGPALGLTLRTAPGAKVVAPAEGTVTFSGPFRSFGKVLILDQGNGYALILTGLESLFASVGDKVAAGALVGQMGQTKTGGATSAPELYFEVRQAGRPIDPERWLKPTG